MILDSISSNADVHALSRPNIDVLAGEIRDTLVRCAPSTAVISRRT